MKKILQKWFLVAGLVSAGFASCAPARPSFSLVVLGCEGGLAEGNLSCYLVTRPGTGKYVALDAGTVLGGLRVAVKRGSLADCQPDRDSQSGHEGWVLREGIKAYLISHAHIDHVSGLVIESTDDSSKPLMALNSTVDDLRDHVFNWKTWPNFGSEGDRPMNKYRYSRMVEQQEVAIEGTDLKVRPFRLSHSENYPSSAFLLGAENGYLLYCGDTGPDEVERSQLLKSLWKNVAPLIRQKQLKALMLEVSFPDGRKPGELYGHLTPQWMLTELHRLAAEVDAKSPEKALRGLKIVVTHIKPSLDKGPSPRQLIEQQLKERNDLGVQFVFPEQGQRLDF